MTTPDSTRDKAISRMARAITRLTYRDAYEAAEQALTAYESHLQAEGMAVVPVADARAPVFAFLLGEGPLDGRWFGDAPPVVGKYPRPYWWRKNLRETLSASPSIKAGKEESK